MKFQPHKQVPVLITAGVIGVVSLLALARLDFFERLENMTYDWRVRMALHFPAPVATNFAFAPITDESIDAVKSGELGYRFGLYWPRQVYGRLVRELTAQGADTIAFDVLFGELREDHKGVQLGDDSYVDSDQYFADEMSRAGNVLLAATTNLFPPELFASAAAAIGDIAAEKDSDGILRRAHAFTWHRRWHPALRELESRPEAGVNLRQARIEPGHLYLPLGNARGEELDIELDSANRFRVGPAAGDSNAAPRWEPVFVQERVWHLGILMAARHLKLDLANAAVDLERGTIALRSPDGLTRVIPVDREGRFWVDWTLRANDARLTSAPVHLLLRQCRERSLNEPLTPGPDWRGKLVVIGSAAQGNDLTDLGATPLERTTFLVSKHWNVANSLITGRFISPASPTVQLGFIVLMGVLTGLVTWRMSALPGLLGVVLLVVGYAGVCVAAFGWQRLWLPMVLPLVGVVFVEYALLVAYRVVFEQREQRRVKGIFSKVVSPNIARELLGRESLSLSGVRAEVTVMFADVRGFTELTDRMQQQAAAYVREKQLAGKAAEAAYQEAARETLNAVNAYLALVADVVKQGDGTLDKYIGDCVMAFWGAPTPQPDHAVACVRAAIEAQRAIQVFNAGRVETNRQLEMDNAARRPDGSPPRPLLPILSLGTGINSGVVTVGLMGSNAHILNYTVFGREVNLASRLEGVSGHGRIVIGEATYQALQREAPDLAGTCIELEPTKPKGFQQAVRIFEVPWKRGGEAVTG